MLYEKCTACKAFFILIIGSTLFCATNLHAEERLTTSETFSARTKEFLSDPARTGSLVGSIIAGAAVANPLAPLVGSVAGFLIGKRSAYSNDNSNDARRQAYINRSLAPEDGLELTSLSGLTGNQPQASELVDAGDADNQLQNRSDQAEQDVIMEYSGDVVVDSQRQAEHDEQASIIQVSKQTAGTGPSEQVVAGLSVKTTPRNQPNSVVQPASQVLVEGSEIKSVLPQQIADACSNVQLSQPLSLSCYYYSQ